MNTSTLTLKIVSINPAHTNAITLAQAGRTLARKWDMLAVIGLMVSSAAYSVYAVSQMTGF